MPIHSLVLMIERTGVERFPSAAAPQPGTWSRFCTSQGPLQAIWGVLLQPWGAPSPSSSCSSSFWVCWQPFNLSDYSTVCMPCSLAGFVRERCPPRSGALAGNWQYACAKGNLCFACNLSDNCPQASVDMYSGTFIYWHLPKYRKTLCTQNHSWMQVCSPRLPKVDGAS